MLTKSFRRKKQTTFQKILDHPWKEKFQSRPKKVEVSGVLTPGETKDATRSEVLRLITHSREYKLNLSKDLLQIARKILWEEVTAKGTLNVDTQTIEVERLSLKKSPDERLLGFRIFENSMELDLYTQAILRFGCLEPELGP